MAQPIISKGWRVTERIMYHASGTPYPSARRQQERWVQSRPYNLPMPYRMIHQNSIWLSNPLNKGYLTLVDPSMFGLVGGDPTTQLGYNRAWSRLQESIFRGDRVEGGINIATIGQTKRMFGTTFLSKGRWLNRITSMALRHDNLCRDIRATLTGPRRRRKRRQAGILKRYGVSVRDFERERRKRKNRDDLQDLSRDFASEYLLYHFAWSPIIADLFSSLTALGTDYDFGEAKVRGTGMERFGAVKRVVISYPFTSTRQMTNYDLRCAITCRAKITNKVVFVLNRLGLINPLTVLWDLVPFSFVADWFGNFSQMLASPTDFCGLTITKPEVTYFGELSATVNNVSADPNTTPSNAYSASWAYVRRQLPNSLPFPQLALRNPLAGGWRRAAAAVSLLTLFGLRRNDKSSVGSKST